MMTGERDKHFINGLYLTQGIAQELHFGSSLSASDFNSMKQYSCINFILLFPLITPSKY